MKKQMKTGPNKTLRVSLRLVLAKKYKKTLNRNVCKSVM